MTVPGNNFTEYEYRGLAYGTGFAELTAVSPLQYSGVYGQVLSILPASSTQGGYITNGTQDIAGDKTFKNNVVIEGTTTTIDSQNLLVEDQIIEINRNPVSSTDTGILYNRYQLDNDSAQGDVVSDVQYDSGALQGATINTVTLKGTSSSTDNFYKNMWIKIDSGAGINQVRKIINYTGVIKLAYLSSNFTTIPSASDNYSIYDKTKIVVGFDESANEFIIAASYSEHSDSTFKIASHTPVRFDRLSLENVNTDASPPFTLQARNSTIFVGKHGNNSWNGTSELSPKLTIQAGINASSSGTTVVVLDSGSYTENLTFTSGVHLFAPSAKVTGTITLNVNNQITLYSISSSSSTIFSCSVASSTPTISCHIVNATGNANVLNVTGSGSIVNIRCMYIKIENGRVITETTSQYIRLWSHFISITGTGKVVGVVSTADICILAGCISDTGSGTLFYQVGAGSSILHVVSSSVNINELSNILATTNASLVCSNLAGNLSENGAGKVKICSATKIQNLPSFHLSNFTTNYCLLRENATHTGLEEAWVINNGSDGQVQFTSASPTSTARLLIDNNGLFTVAASKTLACTQDCTLNQNLSTTSSPTYSGLTIVNAINEFSTDGTLAGNSDSALPSEKAVKTYVDAQIAGKDSFLDLTDTPSTYANPYALHRINAGKTALEESLATVTTGSGNLQLKIHDTTTYVTINATKHLTVSGNSTINQDLTTTSSPSFIGTYLQTSGGTPAHLNYYEEEEDSTTYDWTGAWASNQDAILSITRVGKNVTINIYSTPAAANTGAGQISLTANLPSKYRPTNDYNIPVVITDNGTDEIGRIEVNATSGLVSGYRLSGAFTGSGLTGISSATLSYKSS